MGSWTANANDETIAISFHLMEIKLISNDLYNLINEATDGEDIIIPLGSNDELLGTPTFYIPYLGNNDLNKSKIPKYASVPMIPSTTGKLLSKRDLLNTIIGNWKIEKKIRTSRNQDTNKFDEYIKSSFIINNDKTFTSVQELYIHYNDHDIKGNLLGKIGSLSNKSNINDNKKK